MSETLTCKDSFDDKDEQIEKICQGGQVSDWQLKSLLTCRAEKMIDFLLVDIREMFEYFDKSIEGTDLLLPTSSIHLHMDKLEENKDKLIVLYCRTGSRTGQMLHILKRMGFLKIAHLSEGIVTYSGSTLKNAPLPN
jgi:rhodanese-related sulfurtransferase